jgi:hypothetical protein
VAFAALQVPILSFLISILKMSEQHSKKHLSGRAQGGYLLRALVAFETLLVPILSFLISILKMSEQHSKKHLSGRARGRYLP